MKKYKQYPFKFKLDKTGIEWWQSEVTLGSDDYFYYFRWGLMDKEMREALHDFKDDSWYRVQFGWPTFGLHKFWHDCPHGQLCLHWIVFYWSTPWTNMPKDYWNKKENNN